MTKTMTKKELNVFVKDVLNTLAEWCTIGECEYYDGRSSMILEIIFDYTTALNDEDFDYVFETVLGSA